MNVIYIFIDALFQSIILQLYRNLYEYNFKYIGHTTIAHF